MYTHKQTIIPRLSPDLSLSLLTLSTAVESITLAYTQLVAP